MDNNNLIDRYFEGEMSEVEMREFETSLQQDPVLEKEFIFQQEIIETLKASRMAELKANLNAIDISSVTTGIGSTWIYKTVASVVVVGGAITYFAFFNDSPATIEEETTPIETITSDNVGTDNREEETVSTTTEIENIVTDEDAVKPNNVIETDPDVKEESQVRDTETTTLASPEVTDDFGDIDDAASNALPPANELIDKSAFEHSTISVVVNNNKKKYTFHYQLKANTLILYGTFDKVYEVLDFKHDDQSDLFFFYDNKYYDIDDSQSGIKAFQEMEGEELTTLKQKLFSNEEAKSQ